MKTKLSVVALLFAMTAFGSQSMAAENEGLNKADLDQINAACKNDSRDAENPEWYLSECIEEAVQALKVERGLAEPDKEKS